MRNEELNEIYLRDLGKLEEEINLYPDEAAMWVVKGEIKNSGGNLCLHVCGGLLHFIGATLGGSGYLRNRDAEFADKNVPRARLIELIHHTKKIAEETLGQLNDDMLAKEYPLEVLSRRWTTGHYLTHLATHFNYHLGQINYHRSIG